MKQVPNAETLTNLSSFVPAACAPSRQLRRAERRLAATEELLRALGDHKKAARLRKWAKKVRRIELRIKEAKLRKERFRVDVAYWRIVAFIRQKPHEIFMLEDWVRVATCYMEPTGGLAELRVKQAKIPDLRIRLGSLFDEDNVAAIAEAIAGHEEKLLPYLKLAVTRLCASRLMRVEHGKVFHEYPVV